MTSHLARGENRIKILRSLSNFSAFITKYYEISPILLLMAGDMIFLAIASLSLGHKNASQFAGETTNHPWDRRSLIDVKQPNWVTLHNCFKPNPELHQIYTEMDEKEREYNERKALE